MELIKEKRSEGTDTKEMNDLRYVNYRGDLVVMVDTSSGSR